MIGFATSQSGTRATLGVVFSLMAVLAYSPAVVVQKPVLARVSPFQVTWLGCVAATVVCLPFAPTLITEAVRATTNAIGWTIYLGSDATSAAGPRGWR